MNPRQYKWDKRYLAVARLVASWSKDPSTKVGAVIVRDNRIVSTGFNGFPPGENDSPHLYADRLYKNKHVVHAEINALNACELKIISGGSLYTSFPACGNCIRRAASEGIARVVQPELDVHGRSPEWGLEWGWRIAEAMDLARRLGIVVETIRDV